MKEKINRREILPSSIVLAIVTGFEEKKGKMILTDTREVLLVRKMHLVMQKLAREFPEIEERFHFQEGPGGPISKTLERLLSALGSCGVAMFSFSHADLEILTYQREAILKTLLEVHHIEELRKLAKYNRRFRELYSQRQSQTRGKTEPRVERTISR